MDAGQCKEFSMWSVSRVESFVKCPYQYKLRYIDKLDTLDDYLADNPLKAGTALHECIQIGPEKAIANYFASYPVVTDDLVNQQIAIELLGNRAKDMLPEGQYEYEIDFCGFIGYIDLLVRKGGNKADIYDFKFCSNASKKKYLDASPQLHAYKYYIESIEDIEIENLYYVFVPKPSISHYKGESLTEYRDRLKEWCLTAEIDIIKVDYQPAKVGQLVENRKKMTNAETFEKNQSALCNWCQFKDYCFKGEKWMLLPRAERTTNDTKKSLLKIWLYGGAYAGKTYIADKFPMPLQLNTDGNTKQTTAPVVEIKDVVEMHGKAKQVTTAWEVFKDAINELEKGSEFKTVVVDLVEDVYESCRLYMYDKLNITHESDDSFRAWDKVRIEFLSTMRKLTNLPYNIVLISQEDTNKDITKKSGEKMSTVTPALQDKIAKKISGMVDVTARCVHDEKGYKIFFNTDETQFGGCRMKVEVNQIESNIKNLFDACGIKLTGDSKEKQEKPIEQGEVQKETSIFDSIDDDETEAEQELPVEETPVVEEPKQTVSVVTRRVRRGANN